jgi:hypothetical protein
MSAKASSPQFELQKALIKAHAELLLCPMDSVNPAFKSKYASLESVLTAIKPVLAKHGLAVLQMPLEDGKLRNVVIHEAGGRFVWTSRVPSKGDRPHDIGSALTYARRYSLVSLFGIVGDPDDDGNASSGVSVHVNTTPAHIAPPTKQSAVEAILASAIKNGWTKPELTKLLMQEYKKDKLELLERADHEKIYKAVSNFKPNDLLN